MLLLSLYEEVFYECELDCGLVQGPPALVSFRDEGGDGTVALIAARAVNII
jgi:hypothetical protein